MPRKTAAEKRAEEEAAAEAQAAKEAEAKAQEEADAKAKEEADAKAKEEADAAAAAEANETEARPPVLVRPKGADRFCRAGVCFYADSEPVTDYTDEQLEAWHKEPNLLVTEPVNL